MNPRALVAVAAVAAVAGYLWIQRDGQAAAGPLVLYGNVDIREVDLAFRVGGRLAAMHLEEGDPVSPGALLAELDGGPYGEELRVAEAQVAQARAQLDKMQNGPRPQEVRRAEAALAEAEAGLANAGEEAARLQDLIGDGATSQRELDAALARLRAAEARTASARESLALLREGFRAEDIAAARAQLALAEARAGQAQTRLDDTRLLAPSAGTLITRAREPGAVLSPGQPVYVLSLDRPVWIRAYVDEPSLGQVRPGLAVEVRSDSSEKAFRGQVGFVSPRAEFTPRSVETETQRSDLVYRLRIVVSDADETLRQGMPVTVTLAGLP